MWLTTREICSELRIRSPRLVTLRKLGKIQYIKLGTQYRYRLPEPSRLAPIPQIERIGMLTYDEMAEVLGLSREAVRFAVHVGRMHPIAIGRRRYFTILELRRILAEREQRTGQGKRGVSKLVVDWARRCVTEDDVPVEVLDGLLKEASKLSDPGRSQAISRLWQLFDEVNEILMTIRKVHRGL